MNAEQVGALPPRDAPGRNVPDRIAAAARLAGGLALAVVAGEAAAQSNSVCSNTPAMGQGIYCHATTAADLSANTSNLDISTATFGVRLLNSYNGWTQGESADVSIEMRGGSITTTSRASHGIYAEMSAGASVGDVSVDLTDVDISVTGDSAHGIFVDHRGMGARKVRMSGGSIETAGEVPTGTSARGIFVDADRRSTRGKVTIDLSGGISIKSVSDGIYTDESTIDGTEISLSEVSIETRGASGGTALHVLRNGQVETEDGVVTKGDLVIDLTNVDLVTAPGSTIARGVRTRDTGTGDIRVTFTSGSIRTGGVNGVGVEAEQGFRGYPLRLFGLGGGSVENHGGWSGKVGAGSITTTLGAEARIEAPFSVGVSAMMGNPKVGTGRIVVGHAGRIEARDAGIVAWAARWSGSTSGEGYEATADDAARTAPMIHLTSSGDVRAGSDVMDDFIRARVAGDDGTLSTAERSVLDAIVEDEDPDALDTALDALPASYADDYKAEARALLASRTWAPDSASGRSDAEADRILGLPVAGIRALVHSHNRIALHVGDGDVDQTLAGSFFRTPEQEATLDAQRAFSESEEEVMRAVLAGGEGLEALLDALPAAYTDDWKDETRRLALLYNEGDVRVDVTGGTIVSEGHGIDARYAVRHERNGAIEVRVAEGASVTGGEAGIHVAGAGLGDLAMDSAWRTSLELDEDADVSGLRRHFVTVHGTVRGGTDAAVHLAGGGVLWVGPTGKVLAGSSGNGVLVNDPGVAHVHVQGEVKGAEGGAAAVHLTGGGTVRVGESGRVLANGAARAIRIDLPPGATPMARVTLLVGTTRYADGSRPSSEDVQSLLDRVKGSIGAGPPGADDPPPGNVVVSYADGSGGTLESREGGSPIGPDGMVDLDPGAFPCPPGQERGADGVCRPPCPPGRVRGADGECGPPPCPPGQVRGADGECGPPPCPPDQERDADGECRREQAPPPPVMHGFSCDEALGDDRCRLYEALPSMLLAMNGLPGYEERTSAARGARGGWARVEVASGKWRADTSTRRDLAYDHRRQGLRAGLDFAAGDAGLFGVSVHGLRGSAEMASAGEVALAGTGLGVHATRSFADTFHLDAQAAVTWYDVDVESADPGAGKLAKGVKGKGFALGVEVGRRVPLRDGVSATPRAGLAWSTVDLDDFAEAGEGGRARVSVEDARSLKGRVGIGVEKTRGDDAQGSRLFGSLDLEREFREETEARVSGASPGSSVTSLKAKAERSAFRLAVGGARVWGEGRYSLRGSVGCTASGGGNRDLGGGLRFAMRF